MTDFVLVVDDTQIARCATALTLRRLFNYEVIEADSGYSAIEILKDRSCAAILMDCEMPGMNGFQCTQQIRELDRLTGAHTPIIGLTAITYGDIREKCLQAGMDDYLDKGCSNEELHNTILKWFCAMAPENRAFAGEYSQF
jgi:CheY-like chemotaxis protein